MILYLNERLTAMIYTRILVYFSKNLSYFLRLTESLISLSFRIAHCFSVPKTTFLIFLVLKYFE